MPTKRQIEDAAAALEDLLAVGKQIVADMRVDALKSKTRGEAYKRAYMFRRLVGRDVVQPLGTGSPWDIAKIEREYFES